MKIYQRCGKIDLRRGVCSKKRADVFLRLIGKSSKEAFTIEQKHSVGCALVLMGGIVVATVLGVAKCISLVGV